MPSQLRNESAEKEINCYDETTSVRQQSWWVVAVPGGLPFSVYLHISCFLASLSTLPPLEHTHMILWSIFKTAKHCWNRCNDPTVNLAYSVSPQRQATPSCVHLRGLLLRQGCQPKIFKNYVFDILWMEFINIKRGFHDTQKLVCWWLWTETLFEGRSCPDWRRLAECSKAHICSLVLCSSLYPSHFEYF